MDLKTVAAIAGPVVGAIAVVFAVLTALRSRQVFRPALIVNNGMLPTFPEFVKTYKRRIISTLVYGGSVPQNSEVLVVCPWLLQNKSKLPVYNITLLLRPVFLRLRTKYRRDAKWRKN